MRTFATECLVFAAATMTALALSGPAACVPKRDALNVVVRIDSITDGACEIVQLVTKDAVPVAACLALDALEKLAIELLTAKVEGREAKLVIAYPTGEQEVVIPVHALDRALGQTQIAKARWAK